MPGIHIRNIGESQRNQEDKDSALTVPGSYWLCHKKRIFKFKLKYDKNYKYTSNHFQYEKEMLKIFRRIIKEQPTPGQQFNTSHLLVTYNHSVSTRKEKMFAMVKFHEKSDVTVYHLVFVLTIKIIRENPRPVVPSFVNGTKLLHDEKKKIKNSDKKREEPSESTLKVDELSSKNGGELSTDDSNQNLNDPDHQKPVNPSASFFGDLENLPLLERYLLDQPDQPGVTPEVLQGPLNDMQETIDMPYQYLIEREIQKSISIELSKINNKNLDERKVIFEKIPIGNESQQSRKNEKIVSVFDKKNDEKLSIEGNNVLKKVTSSLDKLKEMEKIEKNIPSKLEIQSVTPAVLNKSQSPPGEVLPPKEKETTPPRSRSHSGSQTIDPPIQRSANITDLVMEGLMFTIRQDKDSLTVVEQKTKLEPDEVLENSEKIETIEGAKCLVNSSLLRLENLVTKIDKSSTKKFNNNFKNNILPSSFFGQNICINNDNNYLNNSLEDTFKLNEDGNKVKSVFPFDKINGEGKSLVGSLMEVRDDSGMKNDSREEKKKENDDKEEEKENEDDEIEENEEEDDDDDDEDIIPEVMRKNNNDSLGILHDETNLLMDDFDEDTPANNPSTPTEVNKTPRIVSNEIVKYDLSALRPVKLVKSGELPDETLDRQADDQQSLDKEKHSVDLDQENKLLASGEEKKGESLDKEKKLQSLDEEKKLESLEEKNLQSLEEKKLEIVDGKKLEILDGKKELTDEKKLDKIEKPIDIKLEIEDKPENNTTSIVTRESSKRLSAKRKLSCINNDNVQSKEIEIEMWKFLQDMQHGVRVVIKRLDLSDMSKRKKYFA